MNKNKFSTASPTFPIQGDMGQILVQFGFSKIEIATLIIANGLISRPHFHDRMEIELLPETIAEHSYLIAEAIFNQCEDEYIKQNMPPNNKVIITE